jgi:DNA-binding NarL/FixJ family response regulator
VPNSFEFKGGAIFITNINFQNIKSKKLQDHLAALESRCHYIDLTIHTEREKMLRIKQIVADGMLTEYDFTEAQTAAIIEFIDANKRRLRELSLRTVLKTADLVRSFPGDKWQRVAQISLMK